MSKTEDAGTFIAMASFWALNYPLVKFAIVYQSSLSLLFFRIFFAAITSFIIFRKGIHFPRDLATNLKILVFALLNLIFFMGFWFVGESTESSALSSIVIYSYPVITIAFSAMLLGEKLSRARIAGTAVGFAGLIFVFVQQLFIKPGLGLVLLILAALSWSLATIFFRKYLLEVGSMTVNSLQFLYALPIVAALVFPLHLVNFSRLTPTFLIIMVYMGALSTSVAYWIYIRLYTKYSVSEISAFFFTVPALSIIFSYFILKENNTLFTYGGFALIGTGIFLSSWKSKTAHSEKVKEPANEEV